VDAGVRPDNAAKRNGALNWSEPGKEGEAMNANKDDATREEIRSLLAGGLGTEAYPRADTHEQVQELVKRLQEEGTDLPAKLVIAGFLLSPVHHNELEQSCRSCMYYLIRRRHCTLPELDVPVEADWSCRLWRI
jgi:hypothetical protein